MIGEKLDVNAIRLYENLAELIGLKEGDKLDVETDANNVRVMIDCPKRFATFFVKSHDLERLHEREIRSFAQSLLNRYLPTSAS